MAGADRNEFRFREGQHRPEGAEHVSPDIIASSASDHVALGYPAHQRDQP
jgi:hypothetical protein